MKIEFIEESPTSWAAVSSDVVYDRFHCEEIYWSDVDLIDKKYIVRWQDSYNTKHDFGTREDAFQFILLTYQKHKPFFNGRKYEI